MRIAFHSPLKSPDSPRPSGDRRMARLLMKAMTAAGHEVRLASRIRTRDATGDPGRQARMTALGARLADRLVRRYRAAGSWCPDLWFTYHLFYKAPDVIGPVVASALSIPYVVAEASHAPKRAKGPWRLGHFEVEAALARANLVIGFNHRDRVCVEPVMNELASYETLLPFLEIKPTVSKAFARDALIHEHGLNSDTIWLLAVGMMRDDTKLQSYRVLAEALARLDSATPWQLIVVGDGPARTLVEEALGPNTVFTGLLLDTQLSRYYAASDLFVWPSVREAYGMALLEAQSSGLPAIAGDSGGVSEILRDGITGLLCPEGDAGSFAGAVDKLLDDPKQRCDMGKASLNVCTIEHGFDNAARRLDELLVDVLARFGRGQ